MSRGRAVEIALEQIRRVSERDRKVVTHTPVTPSAHLGERYGGSVVLKAEKSVAGHGMCHPHLLQESRQRGVSGVHSPCVHR